MDVNNILRSLPKIDKLMEEPCFQGFNKNLLTVAVREAVENARNFSMKTATLPNTKDIINDGLHIYKNLSLGSLKKVINATGIPIHTNLGRSPLPEKAFDEAKSIVCGYSNLEFDTEKGKRGDRYHHAVRYLQLLTGAEDAIIVNNNAAAVFLILNTLSKGKEAIVSRGELVEIGGSFRVPDVMKASGAKMVEIGTTNKTRIGDYITAVTSKTAVMMKVHKSNYEISGFSEEAGLDEMVTAAKEAGVLSYYDAGSGLFTKLLPDSVCSDKTLGDNMKTGVDIVSFSGDKMAGGCQAGIIIGKKELIQKIKKNQLMRMLRVDKVTLALLQSVFKNYLTGDITDIPVNAMLSAKDLRQRAESLKNILSDVCQTDIICVKSAVGGGSCPVAEIDSYAVKIISSKSSSSVEKHLRNFETPIIARVSDAVYLDVRTLADSDFYTIRTALELL